MPFRDRCGHPTALRNSNKACSLHVYCRLEEPCRTGHRGIDTQQQLLSRSRATGSSTDHSFNCTSLLEYYDDLNTHSIGSSILIAAAPASPCSSDAVGPWRLTG